MSFARFIYFCAVLGGWGALAAWLAIEAVLFSLGFLGPTPRTMIAGGFIGLGLALAALVNSARTDRFIPRSGVGLALGLLGGLFGSVLFTTFNLPRVAGWAVLGTALGAADGLTDRSAAKLKKGLIGGLLGGLVGGLLFDPLAAVGPEFFSRAVAFTILGVSIGALVATAHVVFKEAWLTVLDGFRPGRQLVLTGEVTVLGRGDHLPLPLLGHSGKDLEAEHARIVRQANGQYVLEDNHTRLGTLLNSRPISGPAVLADGDLLRLGGNILRFNQRRTGDQPRVESVGPSPAPPPLPPGGLPPDSIPTGSIAPGSIPPGAIRPIKPPAVPPKLPPPPPPVM